MNVDTVELKSKKKLKICNWLDNFCLPLQYKKSIIGPFKLFVQCKQKMSSIIVW